MVYIKEAHPSDGWQMESNVEHGVVYAQPQSFAAREEVATACAVGLHLSIPTLLDGMDNAAEHVYNGWPERLYVLSADGHVAYQGGKGPYGFDPEALHAFLQNYLLP